METQAVFKWMQLFAQKIQDNKDLLSQLDTPIGDGDHGGNMARGMAAVMEELKGQEFTHPGDIFKVVSMQLLSKVGGPLVHSMVRPLWDSPKKHRTALPWQMASKQGWI